MTTDAIRHPSKLLLAVKIVALLACLFVGLKFLESFLIYSFQTGGLIGSSAYREKYDVARSGQLLTLALFLATQMIGGAVLRTITRSDALGWGERIKSVLLYSVGFALVTGVVVALIAFSVRHAKGLSSITAAVAADAPESAVESGSQTGTTAASAV